MKIAEECYPCLSRLIYQAAELATENPELRQKAIEKGMRVLDENFSSNKTSISVATPLHRAIRNTTGNPDPYARMKETEVAMAKSLVRQWQPTESGTLRDDVVFAVRGNTIDFFRDAVQISEEMAMPVEFAIDDIDELAGRLEEVRNILYLADNVGEVLFDLNLVCRMGRFAPVIYVVKESPVQNDITLADLERFGLTERLPRVITTGTDTPGVDMDLASDEFKSEFEAADLVIAKGMGYWETLSELPEQGKVFHLLKAKCVPVARSLGVPLNSYVAKFR